MGRRERATPRVCVLEDDADLRALLELALAGEGYEVHCVADSNEFIRTATEVSPDLALLDVRLPGGPDGFVIARRLRLTSDVPIVFVSAADSLEDRLEAFNAGADDYVVKPFAVPELLARVRSLLRRAGVTPSVFEASGLVIDEEHRTVTRDGSAIDLTRIELELLTRLARQRGKVLSKRTLLTLVWGYDAYDVNLVEVHVGSLRRKLEAQGPRVIHTVRGAGYVFRTE